MFPHLHLDRCIRVSWWEHGTKLPALSPPPTPTSCRALSKLLTSLCLHFLISKVGMTVIVPTAILTVVLLQRTDTSLDVRPLALVSSTSWVLQNPGVTITSEEIEGPWVEEFAYGHLLVSGGARVQIQLQRGQRVGIVPQLASAAPALTSSVGEKRSNLDFRGDVW